MGKEKLAILPILGMATYGALQCALAHEWQIGTRRCAALQIGECAIVHAYHDRR